MVRAADDTTTEPSTPPPALVGEDSAVFDLEKQSWKSWGYFVAILAAVAIGLYPVRLLNTIL